MIYLKMDTRVDKFLKVFTPTMMGYFIEYYHAHYKYYKHLKEWSAP
jgi:hypothetical protein